MQDTRHPLSRMGSAQASWLVVAGLSLCHMLNDVMQSLLAAIYPLLRAEFALDFWQIGMMTFAFQVTASLLQPAIGTVTDRHPFPQSLPLGMGATLCGLILLAAAPAYAWLLAGAMLIGLGSAVFHPEASRVARLASGGRFGTAQSLFQVGGNTGTAIGPLLAAFIVVPLGRPSVAAFALAALAGMAVLWHVGRWYARWTRANGRKARATPTHNLPRRRVIAAICILAVMVFVKQVYNASFTSYYTFFLIERFGLATQQSQILLFVYLAGMAAGVMIGGPLADRLGALTVMWVSALGALPFTLLLPHVGLAATAVLSAVIGVVMAAAAPVIVVFAQELVPGRVGMIAGVFFGLSFGLGGIAAALLGVVADATSVQYVYQLCAFLPVLGVMAIFLPGRRAMLGGH
ncbi:MFS transporter [Rhodobacteraceae bacterium WD3A24]|nr:MFS transporter [Rhodobacteraceae bacterium WD3A24]